MPSTWTFLKGLTVLRSISLLDSRLGIGDDLVMVPFESLKTDNPAQNMETQGLIKYYCTRKFDRL